MNNSYVYSDNDRLKYNIENVGNGENILYPHELAFLLRLTFSHLNDKILRFTFYWDRLDVKYPELLFFSLIERGYIISCNDWKVLPYIEYKELQHLVKLKKIKCAPDKDGLIKQIKELYSLTEFKETINKKYFILTEKGMDELNKSGYEPRDEYYAWNIFYEKFGENTKNPIIKNFTLENYEIELIADGEEILYSFKEKYWFVANRYCKFENLQNLKIKFKEHIFKFEKVIEYRITIDKKYLVIVQINDNLMKYTKEQIVLNEIRIKNQEIKVTVIDVTLGVISLTEQIPYSFLHYDNISLNEKTKNKRVKLNLEYDNKGIIYDEYINYFFSTDNAIIKIMMEKYYSKNYNIEILPPLLKSDNFSTYKVKVKIKDTEMKRMIMYLYKKGFVQNVCIKGYSLNYIVNHFNAKIRCRYQEFFSEIYEKNFLNLEKEIRKELLINDEYLLDNYLRTIYPNKLIDCYDCLMYYTSNKVVERDSNLKYIYNNEKIMDKKYSTVLYEMRKEKLIPAKWKSEFELYLIISHYYHDSIFQYTSSWLGKQSLDIYIPSIKLAIEYQGIQHYKAIDFFGGEEEFQIRKKLDLEKKNKLKNEGIRLLEWKYDRNVSVKEVGKFFKANSIALPNFENSNINVSYKDVKKSKKISQNKNFPKKSKKQDCIKFNVPIGEFEKVLMFQKDGTFIKGFNTISEAEKFSGIPSKKISDVINGHRKTYKGYVWIRNTKI